MSVRDPMLTVLLVVLLGPELTRASRIVMTSAQATSHILMQLAVGQELVRRGHDVHIVVAETFDKPEAVRRSGVQMEIFHVPDDAQFRNPEEHQRMFVDMMFNKSLTDKDVMATFVVSQATNDNCEYLYSDKQLIAKLRGLKFDLAIVDPFALQPCPILLAHILDIPFVSMQSGYFPWHIRIPVLPSFYTMPGPWRMSTKPSTFMETVANTIVYVYAQIVWVPSMWNTTMLDQYAPDVPSWNDLMLKSELFLTDNDVYLGCPLPLFPNVISVSGFTVSPAAPLPDDLEQIFSTSNEVILMSFGTIAQWIPAEIVRKFVETFGRLKKTAFIVKLDVPDDVTVPDNVHIRSWIPQNDILGHSNSRLFITHCGGNGLHEAIYHGVPVLGFPLFAEQPFNCLNVVEKGFGLEMNIHEFTVDQLYANIQEMLHNESYRTVVGRMSAAWRDEPMIGRQKAAFWIEHVIKHGGQHLRPVAADMPLYRFLMLDVIAMVFLATFIVIGVLLCAVRVIVGKCRAGSKPKVSDARKKQL